MLLSQLVPGISARFGVQMLPLAISAHSFSYRLVPSINYLSDGEQEGEKRSTERIRNVCNHMIEQLLERPTTHLIGDLLLLEPGDECLQILPGGSRFHPSQDALFHGRLAERH